MLRVLIADDSNSDRLLLSAIVKNLGHQVIEAVNGLEAVASYTEFGPDLVLMDAIMPEKDGFDATREIKQFAAEEFVPIIFLTSLRGDHSLAECLEAGGDDFLTKPYNRIIIEAKINAFSRMRAMHSTLREQRDQIVANNEHLIQEQEIAKRVFDKVAHAGCLELDNIQYTLSPLAVFNGDVLLAAVRPSGNLLVLLGDFTGHGLAAAIGAMPLAQTFYSMAAKGFAVADVIKELNKKLKDILPVGVFCCATLVDLDMRNKSVEIWAGGLPDSIIYRNGTGKCELVSSQHVPLGILSPRDFDAGTVKLSMQNDDRLYLWSDGIIEAQNSIGDLFGEERLLDIFKQTQNPKALFSNLNRAVYDFVGEGEQVDDLSIAEIMMVDQAEFESGDQLSRDAVHQGPSDWSLVYEVRADTLKEFEPLPVLLQILMEIPGLRPHSSEIYTILAEMFGNALDHGVLKLDSSMKSNSLGFAEYYRLRGERLQALESGYVRFSLDYCGNDQSGTLVIKTTDSGEGFDYQARQNKSLGTDGYSGRGLALLNQLCHSLEYSDEGRSLQVSYDWQYL